MNADHGDPLLRPNALGGWGDWVDEADPHVTVLDIHAADQSLTPKAHGTHRGGAASSLCHVRHGHLPASR